MRQVLDGEGIERAFRTREEARPGSRRAYLAAAMFWCFFMWWPTTYVEWAGVPLMIAFLLAALRTPRFFLPSVLQVPALLIAAYWGLQAISLSWTDDVKLGVRQLGGARWIWVIPALWPVINRRRWLIGALAAGALAGNLSQVFHAVGLRLDLPALVWPRPADRNSGWWDPVVGGSLLAAALGLHLGACVTGTRRWRLVGATAGALSLLAIFATGTRGAWLAGAALTLLALFGAVLRSRARVRTAAGAALVMALVIAAGWIIAGGSIARRAHAAREEISAYVERGEITSDTGMRLHMARRAVDAVLAHPFRGLGSGGFRSWINPSVDPASRSGHAHPHNAALHAAATGGFPGALLAVATIGAALYNAWRARQPGSGHAYDAAPFWALLGLTLVSAFDAVQVNSQTSALLATLVALSPSPLPRDASSAEGPREART